MNRQQFRDEARAALIRVAPEVGAAVAEEILNAPAVQRWFDGFERRNPRGIVARFRRWRGKARGLSPEERVDLEEFLRERAHQRR